MTTDQTIKQYVDAHHAEQIDFLRQIVLVPSDTPPGNNNPPAEKAAELLSEKGTQLSDLRCPSSACVITACNRSLT